MTNGPSHDPVHSNQEQKPDVLHPCLTPVLMSNHTPISPWSSTAYLKSSYNDLFWDSVFLHDCPHAFSVDRVKSLFKNYEVQRECCLKCLPLVYVLNDVPYTCSVVSLPFLYPACSFLNLSSTPLLILSIIILHSIFLFLQQGVRLCLSNSWSVWYFIRALLILPYFLHQLIYYLWWKLYMGAFSNSALIWSQFLVVSRSVTPLSLSWNYCYLFYCHGRRPLIVSYWLCC